MCELDELRFHVVLLAEAYQGTLVAHLVTVVRSTKDRDALPIVLHHITLVLHLVGPHHQFQVVGAQEVLSDVWAKRKPNPSLRRTLAHLRLGIYAESAQEIAGKR
jgi:hypothetical protein